MKLHWLARDGHRALIIFCNGWGMDHRPFVRLQADGYDVLALNDYRELPKKDDFDAILAGYQDCLLIAWSMGVLIGQQLFAGQAKRFCRRIAINGTLRPIDDRYGIPLETYQATWENYGEEVKSRFYRRMCREQGVLSRFLEVQPQRSTFEQQQELGALFDLAANNLEDASIYTDIIVSSNDLVMPTAHQIAFWQGHKPIVITGCHFPFFGWASWSDVVNLVSGNG